MGYKTTLQNLVFKNDFMFSAVMTNEKICQQFLTMVLGVNIAKVRVSKEKSMIYHPEYKEIRLDILAEDEKHTHYDIEMQMVRKVALGKRTRYYHSQMDMEMLLRGMGYDKLSPAYVIFICDFDPFGYGEYRYTFENRCAEKNLSLGDESWSIFLNTCGCHPENVPEELVRFLKFVKADLKESNEDFEDDLVRKVQEQIAWIKSDREMEARYMTMEEWLDEKRAETTAENVLELLETLGPIPEELYEKIKNERNLEAANGYFRLAIRVESVEQFMKAIQ